jgi:hypothetical protein
MTQHKKYPTRALARTVAKLQLQGVGHGGEAE